MGGQGAVPSSAMRTAWCMRQTGKEPWAPKRIRKPNSAPKQQTYCPPHFVLARTWRYYRATRYGAPFANHFFLPVHDAWLVFAWPHLGCAAKLFCDTPASFRATQRVLDQSSPCPLLRGQAAKSIPLARCKHDQARAANRQKCSCRKKSNRHGTKGLG